MIVNAMRDLGAVGKGGSNSRFFLCDNNKEYLVKFVEQKTKTAINELVAGKIALEIKLPTPNVVQVNISQNLINLSDELRKRNISEGFHVGIERLPRDSSWDFKYLKNEMFLGKTLINSDDLYGVISFDNWVMNTDRNNEGNNMIEFLPNNQMRYVMVDHGHCFTGNQ